ncbi:hypothetical protein KCV87_09320 [Actinosynnema pretiosum subsp. pretiosum]|uniref:Uncharacterized protein n=1 Tax=Actinosynnema pretiosum subsp. pretiosum TaxID=103721 RepID=A0AA45R5V5_9PSEU|nr:hypothetical protein KCV87_09320 [Actinosynnema pretiosum subsp. pretiosum]
MGRWGSGGRVAGVVALVLGVLAGVVVVGQAGRSGPSASAGAGPGEVVAGFLGALARNDLGAAWSVVAPAEAAVVVDHGRALVAEGSRAGLVGAVPSVRGADVVVGGTRRITERLAVTGVVGGWLTASSTAGDVVTGRLASALGAAPSPGGQDWTVDFGARGAGTVEIATVEVGGRWYASVLHTAVHALLKGNGLDWPRRGIAPSAGSSPGAAVRRFTGALLAGDLAVVIALLPPDEMAAVQAAGPALVDLAGPVPGVVGVRDVEVDVTETAEGARAVVRALTLTTGGVSGRFSREGACYVPDTGARPLCANDLAALLTPPHAPPETPDVLARLFDRLLTEGVPLVTTRSSAGWHVSPARTLAQALLTAAPALTPADVGVLLAAF